MKRNHFKPLQWPLFLTLLSASALCLLLFLSDSDSDSTSPTTPPLPRLAYMISGSTGDAARLKRLLRALYHPRNTYILHLDLHASHADRLDLAAFARSDPLLSEFGNVMVIGKPNLVTPKGPTVIAATLHSVAILLKKAPQWDWFLNLCASDYPLVPQDDLLHILSYLPRDLNFLEHTSDMGSKENERGRGIVIDSGLYHSNKSGIFWAKERRSMPASFKVFMGSSWVMVTKPFLELCVWGWDNLPRTLLLYYANVLSSSEGYFHTLACNHKDFQNTTVNHDLRYSLWDPQHSLRHFDAMLLSGAPFAHNFAKDDPVLDKIDRALLKRPRDGVAPGGWCLANDPDLVKPTLSSRRLEKFFLNLLHPQNFRANQCK